ncbi:MAG: ABC transporter substrate-binding protein [Dehalococcoidales bacterium]|nr:ABC transporter substrate-binding protein [Dehalococcoidales bacterium]
MARRLARRQFLLAAGAGASALLLSACAQPAAEPTKAPAAPAAAPTKAAAAAPAATQTTAPAATKPAPTPAPAGPKKGGTMTLARTYSMTHFSGVWFTRANQPFIRALYNTLIRLDKDFEPQPELAESWEFSPDGTTITLKLRQGVKFHSGEEFTSENVKVSLDFGVSESQTQGSQLRQLYRTVKEVKMPDKYTVQLSSDKPNAMIWDILDTLAMFDKTRVDQLAKTDAGSGPFMVTSYTPNAEVVTKPFPDYWDKTKPYLDSYVIKQIPDASAMVINLESNALDAADAVPFLDVVRLQKQPGYAFFKPYAPSVMYHVCFNPERKPFDNKKVRQAMNYAIDRARFCRTSLQGLSEPTCLMFPKNSWAGNPDLDNTYTFNLDKAKQLLTEAGLGNGFETSILCSKQAQPGMLDLAQIMQADLAKIGVKATIADVESTAYNNQWRVSNWDIVVHTYGRYNRDPGTMLQGAVAWYTKSEGGPPLFESDDFVKWRDEARSTLDRKVRKELYRKIEMLHLDESWSAQVAGQDAYAVAHDYVKDFELTAEGSPFMDNVWLNK